VTISCASFSLDLVYFAQRLSLVSDHDYFGTPPLLYPLIRKSGVFLATAKSAQFSIAILSTLYSFHRGNSE
jgi:hypothetical protein